MENIETAMVSLPHAPGDYVRYNGTGRTRGGVLGLLVEDFFHSPWAVHKHPVFPAKPNFKQFTVLPSPFLPLSLGIWA